MTKILLTNVCKPYYNGDLYTDFFTYRSTIEDGIFALSGMFSCFGLHFLANNLDTPTKVVEFPSKDDFINELKEGYDFVGISFSTIEMERLKEMCLIVRKHSPKTKIIIGGPGVQNKYTKLKTIYFNPDRHADYVCYGEGVNFFRKILGLKPKNKINYPTNLVGETTLLSLKNFTPPLPSIMKTGYVYTGLGCNHHCIFCVPSAFFKHHINLNSAEELYSIIKNIHSVILKSKNY